MVVMPIDGYQNRRQLYQSFSEKEGFILLESSSCADMEWDIMSSFPSKVYTAYSIDDAIKFTKEFTLDKSTPDNTLPFVTGWMGYFSYEFGMLLNNLSVDITRLRLPLFQLGYYQWCLLASHTDKTLYLVYDTTAERLMNTLQPFLNAVITQTFTSNHVVTNYRFSTEISDYNRHIETIKRYLTKGRSYQVNYTIRYHAESEGNSFSLYQHIISDNPVSHGGFYRLQDNKTILSFSPERLVAGKNGYIISEPIKGTIQQSDCPIQNEKNRFALLNSEKDIAENTMIVDLIRNDLTQIAIPTTIKVDALCRILVCRGLFHLVSKVSAELIENLTLFQLLRAVFPGGSITGAPKIESMKIISELETEPREVYCGSLAYFSNNGNFDLNIAIRTLFIDNKDLIGGVGGAIMIDSTAENEYQECKIKIKPIESVLKKYTKDTWKC